MGSRNPPGAPLKCEKIQGWGERGKYSRVQGTVKIFLPKEALISSLPAGTQLIPDEMKIFLYLPGLAQVTHVPSAEFR